MNSYKRLLFLLLLVALPWQTRWIVSDVLLQGEITQYGRLSLYAFDLVLVAFLATCQPLWRKEAWQTLLARTPRGWITKGLFVLTGLSFVSIFWSLQPLAALVASVHLLLAVLLCMAVMVDKDIRPNIVFGGLVVGMAIPAAFGWVQAMVQQVGASTLLGMAAQDPATLGVSVLEWAEGRWLRAYGTFPHPNMFAGFLAFALLFSFAHLGRTNRKKHIYSLAVLGVLLSGALLFTASRAGWVAFGLGLFCFQQLTMRYGPEQYADKINTAIISIALVVLSAGFVVRGPLLTRFDDNARLQQISTEERTEQWSDVKQVFAHRPTVLLTGVGAGNYVYALAQADPGREVWEYQPVHSASTLVAIELGIVAVAAQLGLIWWLVRMCIVGFRRPQGRALVAFGVAILLITAFDHYLYTQVAGLYLTALVLAVSVRLADELV